MAKFSDFTNIWNNVRELDLRPIRNAAEKPFEISLAGQPGAGREALAGRLQVDPSRPHTGSLAHISLGPPILEMLSKQANLYIILVDAGSKDSSQEQALARNLQALRKNVLVLVTGTPDLPQGQFIASLGDWGGARLLYGSPDDMDFIHRVFIPAVLDIVPDDHLALGRQFPLFRVPIAHKLINDTCFSNAAYALSTGLAGVVPVLDIPLTVADIFVLTKAQAFLVYRLGLVFGFSTEWKDYIAEFGSIIGGGFVWRQIARSLVGLIPLWGIVPKVAVAYAGTYVVGSAILQWYLSGRHLTKGQMRELSRQAAARGKAFARSLRKRKPELPAGKEVLPALPPADLIACQRCGKTNPADAHFCQQCGNALTPSPALGG